MGLTPKHRNQPQKKDWESLDLLIKTTVDNSLDDNPMAAVDTDHYSMSKEEIVSELTKNGYKVQETNITSIIKVS